MLTQSVEQRENLFALAETLAARQAPLGVGLRHECWAGVAITTAMQQGVNTSSFYGLTMRQIIDAVKTNNLTPPEARNEVMIERTLQLAGI